MHAAPQRALPERVDPVARAQQTASAGPSAPWLGCTPAAAVKPYAPPTRAWRWYCTKPCLARSARSSAYHSALANVAHTLPRPHVASSPPPIGPSSPAQTCAPGASAAVAFTYQATSAREPSRAGGLLNEPRPMPA